MKFSLAILCLAAILPSVVHSYQLRKEAPADDIAASDFADDDDDADLDLHEELFGDHNRRLRGINILDAEMNIVLSDPSERVLAAISDGRNRKDGLTLDKVKEMYREQMRKLANLNVDRSLYNQDFELLLEKEHDATEKEEENTGFLDKMINLIW